MKQCKSLKKALIFMALGGLLLGTVSCKGRKSLGSAGVPVEQETFSIEYTLTGGIAGFRDKAVIDSDGQFKYTSGDKVVAEGKLEEKDMLKLRELALGDNYMSKEDTPDDGRVYPDKMIEKLNIHYKGETGSTKKKAEIIEMIKGYKIKYKK